jgi:hypothetical protein
MDTLANKQACEQPQAAAAAATAAAATAATQTSDDVCDEMAGQERVVRAAKVGVTVSGPPPQPPLDSPLHEAAAAGDVTSVMKLLDLDPGSVNSRAADGATPIHRAAAAGHLEVVKVLSKAPGCQLNLLDHSGGSALLAAVFGRHEDIAQYLCNFNPSSAAYKLHWAAHHGHLQVGHAYGGSLFHQLQCGAGTTLQH